MGCVLPAPSRDEEEREMSGTRDALGAKKRPAEYEGCGCLFFRNIEQKVIQDFKIACIKRGTNMKEVFVRFMKAYAKSDPKKS